jgi:uncharacterized protein YkwD
MKKYFFLVISNTIFLFTALGAGSFLHEDSIVSWKNQFNEQQESTYYSVLRNASPSSQSERKNGLDYLNQLRKGAGLILFKSNDYLDTATQNHTDYLILHDLFAHYEYKDTYPEGFTGTRSWERGVAAGYGWTNGRPYSEIISAGNSDIYDSIDSHFGAIYHRFSFLSLKTVDLGMGFSKSSSYKYNSVYGFNMANDGNVTETYQMNPKYVLWPYDNYDRMQSTFSNYEDPKPMPECARGGVTANPISIEFNPKKNGHISMNSFKLYGLDGVEINNTKILTKENDPAGKLNENQFVLFAMNSLDVNRGYRAEFSYLESEANQTISWYFKTRSYPYDGYRVVKDMQYDVLTGKSYLLQVKPDNCNISINGYRYSGAPISIEQLEYDLFKVTPHSSALGDVTTFDFYNGMTFSLVVAQGDSAESFNDVSSLAKITDIHGDLNETSGMINLDGRLFVHNDSGGMPWLYEINSTSGTIIRTIVIDGAENIDWEDLASDDTHVYIADIGNNFGSRRDLKIYKILKSDLLTSEIVPTEVINISYADQTGFVYDNFTTPFDADAFIAFDGKLYIFTKNWADYTTRVYVAPTVPGTYELDPVSEKQFDVMITGADYDAKTNSVALVGYSNPYDNGNTFKSMIIVLTNFKNDDFFSGRIVTREIQNKIETGQIESIVFYGNNELYVGSEGVELGSNTYPARLSKTQIVPIFNTAIPLVITSVPVLDTMVGDLYSYDVDATGDPALIYSLGAPSPAKMEIDTTTGVIVWTPDTAGTFNVTVLVENGLLPDVNQTFVVTVREHGLLPDRTIVPIGTYMLF